MAPVDSYAHALLTRYCTEPTAIARLRDGFAAVDARGYAVTQAWAREADLANASVLAAREQPIARPTP